ncbi:adenosylcobinamide-GDP ribazoletransferase [Peribacillus deserti]|uniref:Adenosylcobinamide-GDP ribazoletransferase n=1 Tax=Peribacillus deserti TaxID=673318 RepID=A0A2N5M935_9BACI|nr:adenosylcobinamide-GDP ribazoletransferase [Peribacillus deserti]PLT30813.1 adenosylcobinamide-GDP ribazoletransferase [Peribacillus deserti]
MKAVLQGCILAFQFLSTIPFRKQCEINESTLKWALRSFGIVGLIIGGALLGVLTLLQGIIPSYLLAVLLLTIWVLLTGGLHLDGWMDTADAAGSNRSIEEKREILKDSRAGSFAVIACILLVIWKFCLLYFLADSKSQDGTVLLTAVPVLARLQALWLLYKHETFYQRGLAFYWKRNLTFLDILISMIILIPFVLIAKAVLFLIIIQFLFTYLYGRWASKSFSGINGDLVGASIEGAEVWNLAVLSIYILYVTA